MRSKLESHTESEHETSENDSTMLLFEDALDKNSSVQEKQESSDEEEFKSRIL